MDRKCVICGNIWEVYWKGGPLCERCYNKLRDGFYRRLLVQTASLTVSGGRIGDEFLVLALDEKYLTDDTFMCLVSAKVDMAPRKKYEVQIRTDQYWVTEDVELWDCKVWRILDTSVIRFPKQQLEFRAGTYMIFSLLDVPDLDCG